MKQTPYDNASNFEYKDRVRHQVEATIRNPQRYQSLPEVTPSIQSSNIVSDGISRRNNSSKLSNSLPFNKSGNASQGMSPVPEWTRKSGETEGHMQNVSWNGEGDGYSNSSYQEGPSNYFRGSSCGRPGESQTQYNEFNVPLRFEYLERDRAELLRKLSELEDQLVGSCSVNERGKQRQLLERSKYHHESGGNFGNRLQSNSSMSDSASIMADKRVEFSHHPENPRYTERHKEAVLGSYFSSSSSNDVIKHGNYFESPILRRGVTLTHGQYQEFSSYPTHAEAADPHTSGPHDFYNTPLHHPDCSCFQCYSVKLNSVPQVQSRSSMNTRSTGISNNLNIRHQSGVKLGGRLGYDCPNSKSSLDMGGQITHGRWPSELDSNIYKLVRANPQSMVPAKAKNIVRPIAGGAPFLNCHNCFEVLRIRQEIIIRNNRQQKIQCGACFSFIYFVPKGPKLVVSIHEETKKKSREMDCGSNLEDVEKYSKGLKEVSDEVVEEMLHTRGPSQTIKSFQSDDFHGSIFGEEKGDLEQIEDGSHIAVEETEEERELEHSSTVVVEEILSNHCPRNEANISPQCDDDLNCYGDESSLMVKAPYLSVQSSASNSNKSLDAQSLLSADSSEDNKPKECASVQGELADASDDLNLLPFSAISAGWEQHGYSPTKHAVYWFGTHSQIKRASEEKVPKQTTPCINVVKDISAETEIEAETEVSYNGTLDTNIAPDTKCSSETGDPPSIRNRGFFTGDIKDRVLELARSIQAVEDTQCAVRINEKPIPDHLVKRAEDFAGPILPGNYWYDFRAGFWGVAGGPCLGIIPPKIKEFDYPISKNCSGGTTGVIVNGRELHKKDLDLLHSRGLPTERGKTYVVEISGRVLDKDSGEELDSLGQLAPTIERLGRGFGMRVSRH